MALRRIGEEGDGDIVLHGRMTIDDPGTTSGDTRNPYMVGALEIMLETAHAFSRQTEKQEAAVLQLTLFQAKTER